MNEQQAPVATPTSYWDPERDRPRGRPLKRVRVHNRSTLNLQTPRAWLIQPGVQEIEVYDDEVEALMGMVETKPEMIEQAQESYRLAIAEDAKQRVEGFAGDAAAFIAEVAAGNQAAREAYEYVRARTSLSPQSLFRQAMKRDPLPLVSVEVIGDAQEPKRAAVELLQAEQTRYTGSLGAAIAAGIADAQKPLLAAFAEQTKLLAQLAQRLK